MAPCYKRDCALVWPVPLGLPRSIPRTPLPTQAWGELRPFFRIKRLPTWIIIKRGGGQPPSKGAWEMQMALSRRVSVPPPMNILS